MQTNGFGTPDFTHNTGTPLNVPVTFQSHSGLALPQTDSFGPGQLGQLCHGQRRPLLVISSHALFSSMAVQKCSFHSNFRALEGLSVSLSLTWSFSFGADTQMFPG